MVRLQVYRPEIKSELDLPLFMSSVSAGPPSYADDAVDQRLDLNRHLIRHPGATFFLRVSGDSMTGAGIYPGDLLIVDRAVEASDQSIVIIAIDGELTVKRLSLRPHSSCLESANPEFPAIFIDADQSYKIWGVVSHVIHQV